MDSQQHGLTALHDIRRMMERSSRFISLSGWSGISAGVCALAGTFTAAHYLHEYKETLAGLRGTVADPLLQLEQRLLAVAVVTFTSAFILAFLFTYLRSRKTGIAIWGSSARRLLFNTAMPLVVGTFVIFRMLQVQAYGLVAPASLIFYGLALVNGSKYTLGEVRYLGYLQLVLGIINLWVPGYGLVFWALGFGLLHIIYGAVMWWKYERTTSNG